MICHQTVIKCPHCGYFQMETMPDDVCVIAWQCPGCGRIARPGKADCCVYCAYGSERCPPAQRAMLYGEGEAARRVTDEEKNAK